jgi:hypothetical protein
MFIVPATGLSLPVLIVAKTFQWRRKKVLKLGFEIETLLNPRRGQYPFCVRLFLYSDLRPGLPPLWRQDTQHNGIQYNIKNAIVSIMTLDPDCCYGVLLLCQVSLCHLAENANQLKVFWLICPGQ